jgi:hypothetical protein
MPSLLLQRALPELSGVLESSRETTTQNGRRPVNRLEARLQGIQGSLDAFLQSRVPVTFTGYFGADPGPIVPAPTPVPVLVSPVTAAPTLAGMPEASNPGTGMAIVECFKHWRHCLEGSQHNIEV